MKQPFDAEAYRKEVAKRMPKSHAALQCLKAFLVGGLICVLGQGIFDFALLFVQSETDASTICSIPKALCSASAPNSLRSRDRCSSTASRHR